MEKIVSGNENTNSMFQGSSAPPPPEKPTNEAWIHWSESTLKVPMF